MVKNQVVWAKSLQQAEQHLKTHVVRDDGSELNLTFNVTSFRPDIQACGELSPQAKNILMKPLPSRTDKELQFLHRFTLQLKCFECYSVYVRKELARVLLYKAFEKGRVIIRQGDIGFSLYFILSGSVFVEVQEEDQVTGKKHNQIVHELETGAAFGELALLQDSRRKATIVCKENSQACMPGSPAHSRPTSMVLYRKTLVESVSMQIWILSKCLRFYSVILPSSGLSVPLYRPPFPWGDHLGLLSCGVIVWDESAHTLASGVRKCLGLFLIGSHYHDSNYY